MKTDPRPFLSEITEITERTAARSVAVGALVVCGLCCRYWQATRSADAPSKDYEVARGPRSNPIHDLIH